MTTIVSKILRLLGLVVFCPLLGCGAGSNEPVAVKGKVYFRGEPLAGGMIIFSPDPDRGTNGPSCKSVIHEDGSYSLESVNNDNIVSGWYRVAIAPAPGTIPPPSVEHPEPAFPVHFRNPARSGIHREIKMIPVNIIDFNFDDA